MRSVCPDLAKNHSFGKFKKDLATLFCIRKNFEPTLVYLLCCWAIFY